MFSCVFVTFTCGVSGQVWYLIVSIHDLCLIFFTFIFGVRTSSYNKGTTQASSWVISEGFLTLHVFSYVCARERGAMTRLRT